MILEQLTHQQAPMVITTKPAWSYLPTAFGAIVLIFVAFFTITYEG